MPLIKYCLTLPTLGEVRRTGLATAKAEA